MPQTSAEEIEKIYLDDVKELRKVFDLDEGHRKVIQRRRKFFKEIHSPRDLIENPDHSLWTNGFDFITSKFLDKEQIDIIMKIAANYKNYRIVAHENCRTIGITFLVRNNIDYGF